MPSKNVRQLYNSLALSSENVIVISPVRVSQAARAGASATFSEGGDKSAQV